MALMRVAGREGANLVALQWRKKYCCRAESTALGTAAWKDLKVKIGVGTGRRERGEKEGGSWPLFRKFCNTGQGRVRKKKDERRIVDFGWSRDGIGPPRDFKIGAGGRCEREGGLGLFQCCCLLAVAAPRMR